jgi:acyl carrier protein
MQVGLESWNDFDDRLDRCMYANLALCHSNHFFMFAPAGGVLRDAPVARQTAGSLRSVLAPKLSGCLAADSALALQPVQHRLLFSSVAALLGNVGQANYAAANAALDASAQLWQQAGVQAVSLQWGPWAGGGMATPAVAASLAAKGVGLVQPRSGLQLLGDLISGSRAAAVAAPLLALDWGRMLRPAQQRSHFFAELAPNGKAAAAPPAVLHTSQPAAPTVAAVQEQVLQLAASVTGSSMQSSDAFMSAGLDSLGAVELRNALAARFAVELSATVTFDYPTPAALAAYVHSQLPQPVAAKESSSAVPGWSLAPGQGGSRRRGAAGRVTRATAGSKQQKAAAILAQLTDVAAGVLGAAVPPNQPLMEAGLDSLGAVELRNAVAAAFNLQLPATVTFDYPTLASLASYVAENAAGADEEDGSSMLLLGADTALAPADQLSSGSMTALAAVSCRFPAPGSCNSSHVASEFAPSSTTAGGSNADLAGFNAAIAAGVSLQAVVPPQRWDVDACYHPDGGTRRMYVRFGGWLDGLAGFDAAAFRLSASEAVCLDPQARMLLEHTQELLVSPAATAAADAVQSAVGVYVGCMYTEYLDGVLAPAGVADANSNAIVGHGLSFLVGRTSYTFGLQGPCVSTDTACSSSLVALHMAHGGILAGESAAGVAGGVNVMLIPQASSS